MTLNDKRIIILGGTSGIGLAVAQAAAAEGARIVLASSNMARVQEALASLPRGTEGRTLDLADASAVEAFFESAEAFDHLVYTAGEIAQARTACGERSPNALAASSNCAIGALSLRPNTPKVTSCPAARSSSPQALPERGRIKVGRSRRASVRQWRGLPVLSRWNLLRCASILSHRVW